MAVGPGKYDDICTEVRERAEASGALVLVFGGNKGDGVSIQGAIMLQHAMPALLRALAESMEGTFAEVQEAANKSGRDHKKECYTCEFRHNLPGSCHIECTNPDPLMKGKQHGIDNGWFDYPFEFDPTWKAQNCICYSEKA